GRLLLILDNFEHLVPHAAAVGAWRGAAPLARFLVTSREPLRLPGEALFDLKPLSLPAPGQEPTASEAVELFLDRAKLASRDFSPTPAALEDIAALVGELDG